MVALDHRRDAAAPDVGAGAQVGQDLVRRPGVWAWPALQSRIVQATGERLDVTGRIRQGAQERVDVGGG